MTFHLLLFAFVSLGTGFGMALAYLFWRALRSCRVDWTGLIVDDATGKASHSKLGVHGFNLAVLILMVRVCWNAVPGDGVATILLTVGGLLGASQIASKAIGAKVFGGAPVAASTTTETKLEEKKTIVAPAPETATSNPQPRSTP